MSEKPRSSALRSKPSSDERPRIKGTVVEGTVEEVLPRALYRVRCDARTTIATLGFEGRRTIVHVTPGDTVLVRASERDPGRGQIVGKTQSTKRGRTRTP